VRPGHMEYLTHNIYTLGYAGWAPLALRDRVLALDATLVDVRIAPTSKSPQWWREALQALLAERYRHLPDLGNRNAFNGGSIALKRPEWAVEPIAALFEQGPVVLLCGCADPQRCRRSVAAAFLAGRLGAEVVHMLAPERAQRASDQLRLPGWE
jgi:uncharacterized protein (DUF488 family)